MKCFFLGIFHLIVLDRGWLQAMENETTYKGELLNALGEYS